MAHYPDFYHCDRGHLSLALGRLALKLAMEQLNTQGEKIDVERILNDYNRKFLMELEKRRDVRELYL